MMGGRLHDPHPHRGGTSPPLLSSEAGSPARSSRSSPRRSPLAARQLPQEQQQPLARQQPYHGVAAREAAAAMALAVVAPQQSQGQATARRTARLMELTRVVWLSPLGGGACARALWRWQHAAGLESRRQLYEECRRMRTERDGATDRERQLKRGLAGVREEKALLGAELERAQAEARRALDAPSEEQALRRALGAAQAERDGMAKALREAREALTAREGQMERTAEKDKAEKRQASASQRERQTLLRELADVKSDRKECAAREAAALERARTHRQAMEKMRSERDAALARAGAAETTMAQESEALAGRGPLVPPAEARRQSRHLAGAARVDAWLRSTLVAHLTGEAVRRWALVALGRPAGVSEAEATSMMAHYRDSRRLVKQLASLKEELQETSTNYSSTSTRLKTERRQAATARQERDAAQASATHAKEEAAECKRREEAAKAALGAAKRDLAELRRAYANLKESRQRGGGSLDVPHSPALTGRLSGGGAMERGAHGGGGGRGGEPHAQHAPATQRDVALQEVGALAQELESLQMALASPQRPGRASGAPPPAPPPVPPSRHPVPPYAVGRQPQQPSYHHQHAASPARPSPLGHGTSPYYAAASPSYAYPSAPPSQARASAGVSPSPRPGATATARPVR
jgi:hypothetical protein